MNKYPQIEMALKSGWLFQWPAVCAEIRELLKEREALQTALAQIRDFKVEPFDHTPEKWAEHTPETCAECKRWRDMNHPIQHHCNDWYRLFYSRRDRVQFDEAAQHWQMRTIARDAIDAAMQQTPSPQTEVKHE